MSCVFNGRTQLGQNTHFNGMKIQGKGCVTIGDNFHSGSECLIITENHNYHGKNPVAPNEIWAGDVTYLKTGEGWMYLAVVMDLFSRRIVGWHIDKRMTTDLVSKALIRASMGDVGACWDNAVIE